MPRYMLDTNMCIYLLKHQPESVAKKFAQCRVGEVIMSAITFAELDYGVAACVNPEREANLLAALTRRIKVAPFDLPKPMAQSDLPRGRENPTTWTS